VPTTTASSPIHGSPWNCAFAPSLAVSYDQASSPLAARKAMKRPEQEPT
jgi:hypothetical protein